MKASAFPKLDRPPRKPAKAPVTSAKQVIDEKTWKEWRRKLGASRKEANRLWEQYQEWVAQTATDGPVRVLKVAPWQDWEREFHAFLDEMPRKPYAFLALMSNIEVRRAQQDAVSARKEISRKRYQKQYERRGSR